MSTIRAFSLVCVPVSDSDASIDFYVGKLGLEKRTDTVFGDGQYRWVEVYAPVGTTGIALAPPPPGRVIEPTVTGITFQSDDIDAARQELQDGGVDVDAEVTRMGGPVPDMFWLRDPDGHTLMVVQTPPPDAG